MSGKSLASPAARVEEATIELDEGAR